MAKRYRRQADEDPQNQRDLETALPDQVTDLRTKSSHAECSRTFHMITTEIAQAVEVKKVSILVTTQGLEAAALSRRFFKDAADVSSRIDPLCCLRCLCTDSDSCYSHFSS
jgi:hypothetical protein